MMKTAGSAICALALLWSTSASAGAPPPNVKLGLWESSNTMNMAGASMPGGMMPHTTTHRYCMTAEKLKNGLANMHESMAKGGCTTETIAETATRRSYKISCPSPPMTSVADFEIVSPVAIKGTIKSKVQMPQMPAPIESTGNLTSKWIAADCGKVQ